MTDTIRVGRVTYYSRTATQVRSLGTAEPQEPPSRLRLLPRHIDDACAAWDGGGSAGLGLWLSNHKEQQTGQRYMTTDEYAELVRLVQAYEDD